MENISYCKENELALFKEIWKTKEYRSFPKSILKYLRNDSSLCDSAVLCWLTLYEFAFFNDNFEIQISKKELANELSKSITTIGRILDQLEKAGYIIKYNNIINSVCQKTIIAVRFPQEALQDILKEPNRSTEAQKNKWYNSNENPRLKNKSLTNKLENSNSQNLILEDQVLRETCKENKQSNLTIPLEKSSYNIDKDYSDGGKQWVFENFSYQKTSSKEINPSKSITILGKTVHFSKIKNEPDENKIESSTGIATNLDIPLSPKKEGGLSVFEPHTYINNIIKNNKINNNNEQISQTLIQKEHVVVFLNQKFEKLEKDEDQCLPPGWREKKEKLNALENEIRTKMLETFTNLTNLPANERYLLTRELGEKESQILSAKQRLEHEREIWKKEQQEQSVNNKLKQDNTCVQKLPGSREITSKQMARLQHRLKTFNLDETDLFQRMNEIVYEIRFGSLVSAQDKQHALSVDHAINIALELLRENRWGTPKGLKEKCNQFMLSTFNIADRAV